MPFNPLRNPDQMQQLEGEDAGVQFSHSLEEQIGGQLEAGFILLSLYEDTNGEGRLHELNIPTYLAMLSRKPGEPDSYCCHGYTACPTKGTGGIIMLSRKTFLIQLWLKEHFLLY